MSKRRKRNQRKRNLKENKFTVLTSEEATLAKLPKYNAFACGYGSHGKRKYDRRKIERELAKEVNSTSFNLL